jgi:DNA-directed RNA polymerase subunit B'
MTMAKKEERKYHVYLDGRSIGVVTDGRGFVEEIRANRRQGIISGEVNVSLIRKLNEIHINADRGRARKPYIIVEKGVSKLTPELREKLKNKEIDFNYLIRRGVIEYLDAEEEENTKVALYEKDLASDSTHLEIDPATIFGFTFSSSVLQEFNSVGRHPISGNFMKQGQGLYAINFNNRYDARAYLLYYPQVPMVNSTTYRTLKLSKHPSGQNFVVALSTFFGYNMQDAMVLNRAAVDRGLGRSLFYRTYTDEERRYPGGQQDHFKIPAATTEGYLGEHAYAKISEDGVIEPEQEIKEGDVLIGKVSPPRFLEEQTSFGVGEEKSRDNSVTLRTGEEGTVDNVMISESLGATKIIKVRIRNVKVPEVGDKFASRHGQKGVVSLVVPPEDMPFTKDGIVPDLIINPVSLPRRMTIGHMIETLMGKAGSLAGRQFDGTAFSMSGKERVDECASILEENGFDKYGEEVLYDGRTGKAFDSQIFQGVVYFNRLLHMVSTKMIVRSRGPVQILTHQPTEGKPRKGGLKFGEMERDALVGYGASLLLKERMLDQSDKADIWICKECGDVGYYDHIKNVPVCPLDASNNLEKVEISYAFKLLLDEIKSLHILPRVRLKNE